MDLSFLSLVATSTVDVGPPADLASGAKEQIESYLVQTNIFVVAGAVFFLHKMLERAPWTKDLMANQWVVRVVPFYYFIASAVLVLLPGAVHLPDHRAGTIVLASIWTAACSFAAEKLIGQSLLGDDPRITKWAVSSPGQLIPAIAAIPAPPPTQPPASPTSDLTPPPSSPEGSK